MERSIPHVTMSTSAIQLLPDVTLLEFLVLLLMLGFLFVRTMKGR